MDELKFLLLKDSHLAEDDIQLIKRLLKKEKRYINTIRFLLVLIFGASCLLWLIGLGIDSTNFLFDKLDLDITSKTRKLFEVITFWLIPALWGVIGTVLLSKTENKKQNLVKLSERLSDKYGHNFRIFFNE